MRGWWLLVALALVTYFLRATGTLAGDRVGRFARLSRVLPYLAPAVLGGLMAVATFGLEGRLVIDPRAVGLLAAGLAILARLPVVLVIAVAMVVTALLRLF